jgi:hypothetical protein
MRRPSSPPVLRVIDGNPKAPLRRSWRNPSDTIPIILPPLDVFRRGRETRKWDFECTMLGMTTAQRNLVWRISFKERERCESYLRAVNRVFHIWKYLEIALDMERREMLAILMEHYPKAARRIMRQYAKAPR